MADTTPSLALPLIAGGQAQKHVTHNEALALLDALVQLAVLDKDRAAPPASPAEGDRYLIVSGNPSGAWTGWSGRIARFQDGGWLSLKPLAGWTAYVADEAELYTFTGSAWMPFRATITALDNLTRFGLGTGADADNPFAAKLNKALWTALTVAEGGSGDLRYTLNKQTAGNTLSLLMQTGFSARAEIGLTGDDDLRVKVSPNGGDWFEALRIARETGRVAFPGRITVADVPVLTAQVIAGNSGPGSIPAGATRYFTNALVGGHPSVVYAAAGRRGRFRDLRVVTQGAPGAGQSWTVTLQNLFTGTALTCTIAGAGSNQAADLVNSAVFEAADRWCLKIVSSSGAQPTTNILFSLLFESLD
ncbi:hypothetical protein BV511_26295 [Methylorubrum extorquens]|uniref:DUF2793 domain-containing protein n=1 Tax=Methylorubrum extorquens TaxID=408 RepID=UPI000972DE39|nr:DUF2793 domain-containing protein [Methylorubrum extorquens]APX87932.1 hypothetical protein BV511_26295 [Methylorubrum extorquens]MCG5249212.1 DUF2793 domain-containing protein [Methylorubrum extorquens]